MASSRHQRIPWRGPSGSLPAVELVGSVDLGALTAALGQGGFDSLSRQPVPFIPGIQEGGELVDRAGACLTLVGEALSEFAAIVIALGLEVDADPPRQRLLGDALHDSTPSLSREKMSAAVMSHRPMPVTMRPRVAM